MEKLIVGDVGKNGVGSLQGGTERKAALAEDPNGGQRPDTVALTGTEPSHPTRKPLGQYAREVGKGLLWSAGISLGTVAGYLIGGGVGGPGVIIAAVPAVFYGLLFDKWNRKTRLSDYLPVVTGMAAYGAGVAVLATLGYNWLQAASAPEWTVEISRLPFIGAGMGATVAALTSFTWERQSR